MAATTAGLLSTAVLLSSCDRPPEPKREKPDPIRRATYRSLVARDHLASCAEAVGHPETANQGRHFAELKQFAARKHAGQSIWLGENDWNAVAPLAQRPACGSGEAAYRGALAGFEQRLDDLATAIAEHRE
jgi:hypothetical protein